MITAYVMDTDSTEFRLETVDAEQLDTGKRDLLPFNIDDIDFFAPDTPDTGDELDFIAWMQPHD